VSNGHSATEELMSGEKLYVGNLTYDTTESTIEALFAQHGTVASVALITDRDTGRPKGFGFVEMGTAEEAQAAKAALDGTDLGGRMIKVDVAKEREPRTGGGGRSGGYGGGGGGGYGGGGGGGGYGGGGGGNRW
jgi:RNA recognition motif-containing protein